MTRLALAVAAILCGAGAALAVPALPTRVQVVPVYSTPPAIRVSFTEGGGAQHYTVHKKIGGGAENVVAGLSAGGAGHHASYLDTSVTAGTTYTYRVEACDAVVCRSAPTFSTSVTTTWPISGGQLRVINGFNENLAWAGIGDAGEVSGFHDGVDLGRTTTGDDPANDILAPRGGVVHRLDISGPGTHPDDGFVEIKVDLGGGRFEYDGFNHIATGGTQVVMVHDAVAPGQKIATMGTTWFAGDFDDHTHYQLAATGSDRGTVRHPLSVFTDPAHRDPNGLAPALHDENGDGEAVLYRNHATGALIDYHLDLRPLHGDVDVAAEVTDRQGTEPEQAPIRLGYWIEGPLPASEHLDDVKSAAHPYRLYDYRIDYWGEQPATPCDLISLLDDAANTGCNGVKAVGCFVRPRTCTSGTVTENGPDGVVGWPWPILHHFIVTHAGTETGSRAGIARNQFWRTAAKDDGAAVGSAHANYAGHATTTKAWEARFPDGDYVVHVLASDLVHTDVHLPLPPTRLENFAPFLSEVLLTVDADGSAGTGHPETPQCEVEVYAYRHQPRRPYPDPPALALARETAAAKPVRAAADVCIKLRFSEPMTSAEVQLVRQRGAGPVLAVTTGGFVKTHQDNDTWLGFATLAADPSGASDSSFANDEKDIAIRVTARDRRDAADVRRTLDSDGDGTANPAPDQNHLVKVDLSPMKKSVDVDKTAVRR